MNRLLFAISLTLVVALFGLSPVGAQSAATNSNDAADIAIFFNDRHVLAQPIALKGDRVIAALIRGTTVLVPLRSMFERMGATVSYDSASKTVDVTKAGSDIQVTVGRAEVVINGESRPLDVPPEIDDGAVLVPVRVLSEGMGAYVQWFPERKAVVIRYVTAPAPPPPAPTEAPAQSPPPPAPTPKPLRRARSEHFMRADNLLRPKVFNEFSPGNTGVNLSYSVRGAAEFTFMRLPLMLEGDYRSYRYPHNSGRPVRNDPGFVTVIGGYGQTFVPAFRAHDENFDGRIGVKVAAPRVYVGLGYLHREQNYGYPKQNGVGIGVDKLPDLDRTFSLYGSAYYYPNVSANYTFANSDPFVDAAGLYQTTGKLSDRFLKYDIGVSIMLAGVRSELGVFLDGGYLGDSIHGKTLSPSDASHSGAYLGLGLKF